MKIPKDYKITITARDGDVLEVIELEGYDLDKPMARSSLIDDIQEEIEKDIVREARE